MTFMHPAGEDGALVFARPEVDAAAPRTARALAAKALADWGLADLADDVTLCLSELVTNTLNQRAGELAVRVEWRKAERLIEIAVWDDAPGTPERRSPTAEEADGRGLNIVAALADAWGYHAERGGKLVWAAFTTS